MERQSFSGEIEQGTFLVDRAYRNAFLVDRRGEKIINSKMVSGYLKIYNQTPHEKAGQVKVDDESRFVEVTSMYPGEWFDFHYKQESSFSSQFASDLFVYDDNLNNDKLSLKDYFGYFYENWFKEGYAIGFSPIGLFEARSHDLIEGVVFGRSLLLDLEVDESGVSETIKELYTRLGNKTNNSGFVSRSSSSGTHLYSHAYEVYKPEGKVNLAKKFGSALLLNREGLPKKFDDRSGGHQLRSLSEELGGEFHPISDDSEIGSLRVTMSLLKPECPSFIQNSS